MSSWVKETRREAAIMQGATAPKTRIQLDVSPEKLAEIEALMHDCGLNKKTDLINNSITLLKWAVNTVQQGRAIASVDEKNGKYRELEMPVLSYATSLARRAE